MKRVQDKQIIADLSKKIVLLAGPRQVGKTFIAQLIAKKHKNALYLNYDNLDDQRTMHERAWLLDIDLLILDELHKMPDWKNYLKGVFDTKPKALSILVTGSARLEIFDKVGDSLAGRYFLHRLLPLSPSELKQLDQPINMDALLNQGGFPEPYLATDQVDADRWRMQYRNSMLSTDVFDFDVVHNVKAMRVIFDLLRSRVGSPISIQSIVRDTAVSHGTVKKYIEILEALYIVFRVTPYSKNIARSLLKEPKIYFFDTGLVDAGEGERLENLVALCLLKHTFAKIDNLAQEYSLHYLRTKDGLEVDFALVKDNAIEQIIEVKQGDQTISKSLHTFHKKYKLPAVQVVHRLRYARMVEDITLISAKEFLQNLYM